MLSTQAVPTVITNDQEEAEYAQQLASVLARDLKKHCAGLFGRRRSTIELFSLEEGCHLDNDQLRAMECEQYHAVLPHGDPQQREAARRAVKAALIGILQSDPKLAAYHIHAVGIVEVQAFRQSDHGDTYGRIHALHIVLSK